MKGLLIALAVLLVIPAAASAEVPNSPDVFNLTTLNALDAAGHEVPFTTPQQLAPSYSSAAYTYDASLPQNEKNRIGCATGAASFAFGSRTAWHRVVVGAAGSLAFSATSGYDTMLFAFRTTLARGAKGFTDDVLTALDCQDQRHGVGDELPIFPLRVQAGQTFLLATASACGTGGSNPCTGNEAGGATVLSVTYKPDDRDGDGTADTLDACPDTPAAGGCPPAPGANPDADGDGVLVDRDRCPTIKGTENDGCLDSDKDTVSDAADACPAVGGLGRNGCPQPLKATFPNEWTNFAAYSRVKKLQVKAPRGARVQFRCAGRGCKTKRASFTQKRAAESVLRYLKKSRRLPRGTVIQIRVLAPMTLGTYVRFEVRGKRANPRRTDRCIQPNAKLSRC